MEEGNELASTGLVLMSVEVRMLNVINEQECLFSQSVFTRPSVSPGDQRRADKPLRGRSEGLWGSRVGTGRIAWNKSQKGKLMAIKTHARTHTHTQGNDCICQESSN